MLSSNNEKNVQKITKPDKQTSLTIGYIIENKKGFILMKSVF